MRHKFVGGVLLDGRYQTVSPLNHGSFGMVFMAQDLSSNKPVAIKCLTKKSAPTDATSGFAIDDKSEELILHSRLGLHANIVNLLHHFETDAHVYLVLEFCSQGDLYEAIRNGRGPLQTEHVRQFMLELVDAVAFIHSQGIYHRDIKPENIFLTHDGNMKLGDFGLATTDKWSYEVTVGSDRYMAPEQFDSAGAGYSPAEADIWAIGICLLNILFSRNPFTTPTEADPLFLDFSRDRQSLFDVFPAMSQDTYEVIVQCMNLDPKKRSLAGVRKALLAVVSFTTEDESLDYFCDPDAAAVASTNANREPLRTPSLQNAHGHKAHFPWTKALRVKPPVQGRQLSAIPDDESFTEDLFSKSGGTVDWCSASIQTPSMSSMLGSHLGVRFKSPPAATSRVHPASAVSPMAGSLPIKMAAPLLPAMSSVFGGAGNGGVMSKSWSDMWDEDVEEEQRQRQFEARKELNSRTWSHESREMDQEDKAEVEATPHCIEGDVDDDLVADGFFFQQDTPALKPAVPATTPRYSPPPKRFNYDKWTALGQRRRGQSPVVDLDKAAAASKLHQTFGFGYNKAYEPTPTPVWHHDNTTTVSGTRNWARDRAKEGAWKKGREWNWRRERRAGLGDVEWVGGC